MDDIPWRAFTDFGTVKKRVRREVEWYCDNATIQSVIKVMLCTIREHETSNALFDLPFQICLGDFDTPGIDIYLCILCLDTCGNHFYIAVPPKVDGFLLAQPYTRDSQVGLLQIINCQTLGVGHITTADQEILRLAVGGFLIGHGNWDTKIFDD